MSRAKAFWWTSKLAVPVVDNPQARLRLQCLFLGNEKFVENQSVVVDFQTQGKRERSVVSRSYSAGITRRDLN